jgi:hypothetical protein
LQKGESGKSMLFKQIHHIFYPFQEHERLGFKQTIHGNVLRDARSIASGVFELCIPWASKENKKTAQEILSLDDEDLFLRPEQVFSKLKHGILAMWRDPAVCELLQSTHKHCELQFCSTLHYFMPRLNIIIKPDYVPSVQDVFHTRARTTGMVEKEANLKINNLIQIVKIYDVGGQRRGKMQM